MNLLLLDNPVGISHDVALRWCKGKGRPALINLATDDVALRWCKGTALCCPALMQGPIA